MAEGVEQFAVGDRVACMGGGYALHADRACVPQNLCAAIPDGVSFEAAASVHLAATGLHAIRRTLPLFGENGMIMGMGLVGQFSAQFGQLSGCHIMAVDGNEMRLERARAWGGKNGTGIDRRSRPNGEGFLSPLWDGLWNHRVWRGCFIGL